MYARDRDTPQMRHSTHRLLTVGSRLQQFSPGRVCGHPQCTVRLSRYNPSETCSVHQGWADPRQRQHG